MHVLISRILYFVSSGDRLLHSKIPNAEFLISNFSFMISDF